MLGVCVESVVVYLCLCVYDFMWFESIAVCIVYDTELCMWLFV